MAMVLKILLLSCPPQKPQDVLHLLDDGLATTMHSMRSTISTVLKAIPGALAFSCDILCYAPLIAGWQAITCNREALVNNALLKNTQPHINYDYYIGQNILKYNNTIKGKLAVKTSCPFEIVHVHVNGAVTIQLQASVTEQINICCTTPYQEPLL